MMRLDYGETYAARAWRQQNRCSCFAHDRFPVAKNQEESELVHWVLESICWKNNVRNRTVVNNDLWKLISLRDKIKNGDANAYWIVAIPKSMFAQSNVTAIISLPA